MNKLETQALAYSSAAQAMLAFAQKYGDKLPPDTGALGLSITNTNPTMLLWTGSTPQDKERALSLYGEIFGREGWVSEEVSHESGRIDWLRTIDGVEVTIYKAERLPERQQRMPVPPSKFPLQLEDAPQ